jgi:large subunit ribosomal protein L16
MLVPKRVKHRREFRGKMRGEAKGGKEVAFGEYGLQATTSHWITNRQIEAARIAMTRYMKRGGKVWIKIFPHKSYTAKAIGVRMGSGKGAPEGWVAPVKRGKVMFEVAGVSEVISAIYVLLIFYVFSCRLQRDLCKYELVQIHQVCDLPCLLGCKQVRVYARHKLR